jgi:hypothetical protein
LHIFFLSSSSATFAFETVGSDSARLSRFLIWGDYQSSYPQHKALISMPKVGEIRPFLLQVFIDETIRKTGLVILVD